MGNFINLLKNRNVISGSHWFENTSNIYLNKQLPVRSAHYIKPMPYSKEIFQPLLLDNTNLP